MQAGATFGKYVKSDGLEARMSGKAVPHGTCGWGVRK